MKNLKKSSPIKKNIETIKQTKYDMGVKRAIEYFETEAITDAVSEEVIGREEDKDESDRIAEKEVSAEKLELNPERKEAEEAKEKLIEYSKRIYEVGSKYEMVYSYFEPSGGTENLYSGNRLLFRTKRIELRRETRRYY